MLWPGADGAVSIVYGANAKLSRIASPKRPRMQQFNAKKNKMELEKTIKK